MKAATKRRLIGNSARDLIEEAVGLLREAPAVVHLAYYLGAIPFWLGLLYFLSDMSQGAYAEAHLTDASLGMAALYIWKKSWQAVSAAKLRTILSGQADDSWSWRRVLRLVMTQAAIQPWSLIMRPLAVHFLIPFGWASAFYQNVTALGDGLESNDSLRSRAWRQAKLWPGQNHSVISIIYLFTIFVWINVFIVLIFLPQILKTLFAIESAYSRGDDFYVNTTFFAATIALTSLAVDPLRKAVYIVRCFRGVSLESGADLVAELRRIQAKPVLACLLAAFLLSAAPAARAETPLETPRRANAEELERSIEEVLERREFSWRAPREKNAQRAKDSSWVQRWLESASESSGRWSRAIGKQIGRAFRALRNWWNPPTVTPPSVQGTMDWIGLGKALLVLIGIAVAGLLGWLGFRWWDKRRRHPAVLAVATPAAPDLRMEHLVADQLPEDGWLRLAREHAARGEMTLALRAAWLAGLAHLGYRELIAISRHKTNRDYNRELRRRARDRGLLLSAFDENLLSFERSWYGKHEVTNDGFHAFEHNLERIRQS